MQNLVSGIPGIFIPVRNLEKSAGWYQEVLGLEVFKRSEFAIEFKVGEGDPLFILVPAESPIHFPNNDYTGGSFLVFKTTDADALYQKFVEKEVKVSEMFLFEGVQKYFFFEDPDGNKLSVEN